MPIAKIPLNLKEAQRTIQSHVDMILSFIQKIQYEPLSETQRKHLNFMRDTAEILRRFPNNFFDLSAAADSFKNKPYVLLVEDSEVLQLLHREMLIQLGCVVDIVATG